MNAPLAPEVVQTPTAPSLAPVPVLVLGGGPIGLVCALLLARAGIACELVDARPVEALQRDRRLLALSRGSLNLLTPLLGAAFAPLAPIEQVLVSSRGEPGSALLGSADFRGASVGATVWYADLVGALAHAAAQTQARTALLRMQRPRRAQRIDQMPDRVRVTLDDGQVLEGRIAIDAEGTPPRLRQARFCALLAEIQIEDIAPGLAIERFTREGPLALLPLPPATAPGAAPRHASAQRMSMIWCQPAAQAQARLALDDTQLCAQIAQGLGARFAAPTAVDARHVFDLLTHRRAQICEHRLVHLGNAAQTLHPVAGQGFNLGLRDCAALVEALLERRTTAGSATDAVAHGTARGAAHSASDAAPTSAHAAGVAPDWLGDPILALPRYAARRRLDRRLVPALTGALPPLFASTAAPLALARSAGLIALDTLPAMRRAFTRLLMFGAG